MAAKSTYQAAYSQGDQNQHTLHTQPDYGQDYYGQYTYHPSLQGTNKSGRPSQFQRHQFEYQKHRFLSYFSFLYTFKNNPATGGPRNIYTNPKLQRLVEPSLFQVPSSILQGNLQDKRHLVNNNKKQIGDPYKDPYRTKQITDQQRIASIPHGHPFKPTDVKKTMQIIQKQVSFEVGGLYEHMKDFDDKTYRTRDENGTIITGPKNFMTNPNKRGLGNTTVGHLFNPVTYSNDPYHRAKEMDVQERLEHKSKVLDLKKPFCSTQHGRGIFNSNRFTYGLDRNIIEGRKRSYNFPPAYHPKCFKNADKPKQGYNKTFSQFPEYIAEGDLPEPQQKKTRPSITQGNWRPNSTGTFSRPTPNITSLLLNKNKMSAFRV